MREDTVGIPQLTFFAPSANLEAIGSQRRAT
jgi:hypothetical protein